MRSTFTAFALSTLCGCAGFNQYGTARTLPAGESNLAVTIDGATEAVAREKFDRLVPVPRLRYQRGLAEGAELDLAVGLGLVEGALKYELLRSDRFDLAVAPGLSMGAFGGGVWLGEVHAPLVADLVVAPWFVVVPHAGAGWAISSRSDAERFGVDVFSGMSAEQDDDPVAAGPSSAAYLSGGLGLYFRLGDSFAIQPAFTTVYEPEGGSVVTRAGLMFAFGAQPAFP